MAKPAGDPFVFSANGSFDPDGFPLYYIWTFPNDVIAGADKEIITYTNFTQPGNYTVVLTVRDVEALEDNASVNVTIGPPNLPPVALIASPSNGSRFFANEFINFSGNGSFDPEGTYLTYFWEANVGNITRPLGTGENLPVRLVAGDYVVTLTVVDMGYKNATATVGFRVEVDLPPRVEGLTVSPQRAFDGDPFAFEATYTDDNNESAGEVLLVLDGAPHPMALASAAAPREGERFALTLAPAAGRHAFFVLASDGNLTNISATVQGPDVWQNITLLSSDRFAALTLAVVPPHAFSLSSLVGPLPGDPAGWVAVSAAYLVNGSALDASNFTLAIAFSPIGGVNASSALLERYQPGSGQGAAPAWLSLVTALDLAGNTGSVAASPLEVPAVFRVFARAAVPPPNGAPTPLINYAGEFYPNSTVVFDAANSTDPENATLLFAWRIEGPGESTGWLPGGRVAVAFPAAGRYNISLRAEDGAGNVAFKNITLEIRERPVAALSPPEEPAALAGLAGAVVVSALLAVWWRGRGAPRKRTYEDLYGRLYKGGTTEEKEYAQLFEKFAAPSEGPASAPDEGRGDDLP